MIASENNNVKVARLLVENGADVNIQTPNGWSALIFTSQNGHTETAKLLLDHGANINMQQNDGWSALMISSQNGHTETCLLYTSPSPRDATLSRMPSSA